MKLKNLYILFLFWITTFPGIFSQEFEVVSFDHLKGDTVSKGESLEKIAKAKNDNSKSAKDNSPDVESLIGQMYEDYYNGYYDEAFNLAMKIPDNPEAQYIIGSIYVYGSERIEPDMKEAVKWLEKSIANDNTDAMYLLGYLYVTGDGGETNQSRGVKLLRSSAEKGNIGAMNNLANIYETGNDIIKKDIKEAIKWYRKGKSPIYPVSARQLGMLLLENGSENEFDEAKDLLEMAAMSNDRIAAFNLAQEYKTGNRLPQSYENALEWYKKAAELGDVLAMHYLGDMYFTGRGTQQNYPEALKWYKEAASHGKTESIFNVGRMLTNSKNYEEAYKYLKKGADLGDPECMNSLGYLYINGYGVVKSNEEAFKWIKKAAETGNIVAMYNVGVMYEKGEGIKQDYSQALEWYKKADKAGYKDAEAAIEAILDKITP